MILKLILSVLLLYYLCVLWKYYRTDIAGLLGKTDAEEGTDEPDEEAEKPGEPYTVIGKSTYPHFVKAVLRKVAVDHRQRTPAVVVQVTCHQHRDSRFPATALLCGESHVQSLFIHIVNQLVIHSVA